VERDSVKCWVERGEHGILGDELESEAKALCFPKWIQSPLPLESSTEP
jgi:hypothetical protein